MQVKAIEFCSVQDPFNNGCCMFKIGPNKPNNRNNQFPSALLSFWVAIGGTQTLKPVQWQTIRNHKFYASVGLFFGQQDPEVNRSVIVGPSGSRQTDTWKRIIWVLVASDEKETDIPINQKREP